MIDLTSGWASDVGRVRNGNEDASFAGRRVFVVADGMGGHAAGEVASRLAVEAMRELDARPGVLAPEAVAEAVIAANHEILAHGRRYPRTMGMGTTLTGIVLVGEPGSEALAVVNIGDSRVYRRSGDALERMTIDHSEVEELVADGIITAEQARVHPMRNVVTRCLGMRFGAEPDAYTVDAVPGDRWLVCSDGLSGEVWDADLAEILTRAEGPQEIADALVAAALEAGGHDNVTVVVVDIADGPG